MNKRGNYVAKYVKHKYPRLVAITAAVCTVITYAAINVWAMSVDTKASEAAWELLFSPTVVVALVVVVGSLFVLMYRMGKAEGRIEELGNDKLSQDMHKIICGATHEKLESLGTRVKELGEKIDMVLVSLSEKKVR